MSDLTCNLAGLTLPAPIMNGAGTCKHIETIVDLSRTASGAIVWGSITRAPRGGHEGEVYYVHPSPGCEDSAKRGTDAAWSLNSLGLPNPGMAGMIETLPHAVGVADRAGKLLIVSVAGFTPDEFAELAANALNGGAHIVELNLGCPNLIEGGRQKPIVSYDPAAVREVLEAVATVVRLDSRIAVKLSWLDPGRLAEVASVISPYPFVRIVVTMNTIPNAVALDRHGRTRITPNKGRAGLGGAAILPMGLGQVHQLHELLPDGIQIIGVGGITTGRDLWEYRQAGAVACQVATAYLQEGGDVFGRILGEYMDIIG